MVSPEFHSPSTMKSVRPAAVAGSFYPAQASQLRQQVQTYLQKAHIPSLPGRARAVIAPHAGYVYSGLTAGMSFAALDMPPEEPVSILLMGPAHYVPVHGVAVAGFQAMVTPLGQIAVDEDVGRRLVATSHLFQQRNDAHIPEHALEVELPFLQVRGSDYLRLIPLLLGEADPERVAATLLPLVGENDLLRLVVSSDLSHFHPYDRARSLDIAFLQAVVEGDLATVKQGEACGRLPILVLMHIASALGWRSHLLDYRNSGDTGGDRSRVVGYGAVAYTEAWQ